MSSVLMRSEREYLSINTGSREKTKRRQGRHQPKSPSEKEWRSCAFTTHYASLCTNLIERNPDVSFDVFKKKCNKLPLFRCQFLPIRSSGSAWRYIHIWSIDLCTPLHSRYIFTATFSLAMHNAI